MRTFMIVASVVVGLSGCGKQDKFDEVLGAMEGVKGKMCACADNACTEKVQEEWRAYRKTMMEKLGKDAKPSEAQDKRGRAIDEAMRTCRKKYELDSGTASPPPAGHEAPVPPAAVPPAAVPPAATPPAP